MGKDWRTPEEEREDAREGVMLGLEATFLGLALLSLAGAFINALVGH